MTTLTPETALSAIPDGLRKPLLEEFTQIVNYFMERRWGSAELSGGRFCEIVLSILQGYTQGAYPATPVKPPNFVNACRALENNTGVPRSFQILIPRILPALYEIRNNRNVGHIGSDVNPDFMDSSLVLAMASWIMGELVRVFHGISTEEAQGIVDNLSERRLPLVWKSGDLRRVLNPHLPLKDQILLLVSSMPKSVKGDALFAWTGYKNRGYFNRLLRQLHDKRLIEFDEANTEIEILPPGNEYVATLLAK